MCVTVMLPSHWHYMSTVCINCVGELGITGCTYRNGEPTEFIFGMDPVPRGWSGRRLTPEELLRAVYNVGYQRPTPSKEFERINITEVLAELWRD
jgi:hypothetical protein